MGTLESPSIGDVYTVRTYKRLAQNPAIVWANTYEFVNVSGNQGTAVFSDFAGALANAEAGIHLVTTNYDRVVISTWVPDGEPYNPSTFVAINASSLFGAKVAATPALSLENCLRVTRNVTTGRVGQGLYRNVLTEGEVHAPAGAAAITNPDFTSIGGAVGTMWNAIQTAANAYGFRAVMAAKYGASPAIVTRTITALSPSQRVAIKKLNNRYFDFATP